MIEHKLIPLVGAWGTDQEAIESLELRCNAIRLPGDEEPWHVFFAAGEDLHVAVIEAADFERCTVTAEAALHYAKLAAFLGDPWADIFDRPDEVLAQQQHALEQMGPKIQARIQASTIEEILDWRRTLEANPVESGELLREQLTGIQPIQGRN